MPGHVFWRAAEANRSQSIQGPAPRGATRAGGPMLLECRRARSRQRLDGSSNPDCEWWHVVGTDHLPQYRACRMCECSIQPLAGAPPIVEVCPLRPPSESSLGGYGRSYRSGSAQRRPRRASSMTMARRLMTMCARQSRRCRNLCHQLHSGWGSTLKSS